MEDISGREGGRSIYRWVGKRRVKMKKSKFSKPRQWGNLKLFKLGNRRIKKSGILKGQMKAYPQKDNTVVVVIKFNKVGLNF